MRRLVCIMLVLALATPAWAESSKLGAAGAQFLKIGVGSKYQGMADAGVATAGDAYAAYWNPAGLVEVENWSLAFTNVNWLLDIDLNYFAAARSFEDVGVFAVSATVLSTGEQEITTVDQQDGTGQYYSASSYAIGLTFARQLTHRFAFGVSAKFIGEELGDVDSRGMALDFGTLLYTGFNSLRIGMSITNMGSDLKFTGSGLKISYIDDDDQYRTAATEGELSSTPYDLPMTLRLGMAYDWEFDEQSMLTLATELIDPSDGSQKAVVGAELGFREHFFLRGGYKFRYDEQTLALGGGLIAPVGSESQIVIDYAWQDFGRLESTQRFSIGFTF